MNKYTFYSSFSLVSLAQQFEIEIEEEHTKKILLQFNVECFYFQSELYHFLVSVNWKFGKFSIRNVFDKLIDA